MRAKTIGALADVAAVPANAFDRRLGVAGTPASVPRIPANVIVATGHGKPPKRLTGARARMMARRAAEIVAVRNLARKLRIGNRIRGFRYAHTAYHADGSVTVTVEYPRR
ncbi:MAG: hypothetical protein ACE5E5_02925 [Phycisphaerae bacterium]